MDSMVTYTVTRTRPRAPTLWPTMCAPSRFSWSAQSGREELHQRRSGLPPGRSQAADCLSAPAPEPVQVLGGTGVLAFWASADFGSGRSRTLPCSIMTDKARAHLKKAIDLLE